MTCTRREMLLAGVAALPALAWAGEERKRLGVVTYSYSLRMSAERATFADPLTFIEHCRQLGAGGVQLGLGTRDQAYLGKLRAKLEAAAMFLEGQVRLPRDRGDANRFAADVRLAKDAGAKVLRTVMLGGRRYETFASADAYRKWAGESFQSLTIAEPIVARLDLRLAVENHKDCRVEELLGLLKRLDSRHVGVCVDTGNSIALLEEPHEVVDAYAPWAYSVHLKDMAVEEYGEGFLLSEVPLGEGYLDLERMAGSLRKARPELQLCLEMITRDPLRIPCLTAKYWATFETLPGRHLADTLSMVRRHKAKQPLPRVTGLPRPQQLAVEEENVRKCLAYASKELGL